MGFVSQGGFPSRARWQLRGEGGLVKLQGQHAVGQAPGHAVSPDSSLPAASTPTSRALVLGSLGSGLQTPLLPVTNHSL